MGNNLVSCYQKTIKSKVSCQGFGLHNNKKTTISLLPQPVNSGISFKRVDKDNIIIPANYKYVSSTSLNTTLAIENTKVSTVEHLLSAISGFKIDNLLIEIDNEEVPIMDGSSEYFSFLIECAGILEQDTKRKTLDIKKEISFSIGDKYINAFPENNFSVYLTIDFGDSYIGKQSHFFDSNKDLFKDSISRARTFCFYKDVKKMKELNLALGGSLNNAIVVDGDRILNTEGLIYKNEFARHKLLDFIGDIYLSGYQINARFEVYMGGHEINNKFLHYLFSDSSFCKILESDFKKTSNSSSRIEIS